MDVGQRLHTHTPSFPFLSPPLLSCTLGGTLNRFVQLSGWTTTRRFENEEKVATNIFFFFFLILSKREISTMFIRLFVTVVFFFLYQCDIGREEK